MLSQMRGARYLLSITGLFVRQKLGDVERLDAVLGKAVIVELA